MARTLAETILKYVFMKQLRRVVIYCLLLLLFCFNSKGETTTVLIRGKIIGFDSVLDKDTHLDLLVIEEFAPLKLQLLISPGGTFELTANVKKNQEFIFKYNGRRISLILNTGDNILIEIDRKFFFEMPTDPAWIIITGHSRFPNQRLITLTDWNTVALNAISSLDKESDLMIFERKKLDKLAALKSDFNMQFTTITRQDSLVRQWLFNQLEYKTASVLCFYPFAGQFQKNLTDTSKYFDFTKEINFSTNQFYLSEAFQNYLKTFVSDMEIICNINPRYDSAKNLAKSQDPEKKLPFNLYLGILNQKSTDIGRSRLIANLFYQHYNQYKNSKYLLDSIAKYVDEKIIKRIAVLNSSETLNVNDCINSYEGSETSKKRIRKLFSQLNGKTVYVSFLLKGCGPCESELPRYKELLKSFPSSVAFIFLGTSFEQNEWNDLVRKYDLGKYNFPLTLPELSFFIRYFELSSYPKHAMVCNDGKIINQTVPGPGNESSVVALRKFISGYADN